MKVVSRHSAQKPIIHEFRLQLTLKVGLLVFGYSQNTLKILLVHQPDASWTFPNKDIKSDSSAEDTASEIWFHYLTGGNSYLKQFKCFSISDHGKKQLIVTFLSLVNIETTSVNTYRAVWFDVNDLPKMKLEEIDMVYEARQFLKKKVAVHPISYKLLPPKFTINQLQKLFELICECKLDKSNFSKRIFALNVFKRLEEKHQVNGNKPSFLYAYDEMAKPHINELSVLFKPIEKEWLRKSILIFLTFPSLNELLITTRIYEGILF